MHYESDHLTLSPMQKNKHVSNRANKGEQNVVGGGSIILVLTLSPKRSRDPNGALNDRFYLSSGRNYFITFDSKYKSFLLFLYLFHCLFKP